MLNVLGHSSQQILQQQKVVKLSQNLPKIVGQSEQCIILVHNKSISLIKKIWQQISHMKQIVAITIGPLSRINQQILNINDIMNNIILEQIDSDFVFETIYPDFYVTLIDDNKINNSQYNFNDYDSYKQIVNQYNNIIAKGSQAVQFLNQTKNNSQNTENNQLLIILDRSSDPITPMLYYTLYAPMCELIGLDFDRMKIQGEDYTFYNETWKQLFNQSLDNFGDCLNKLIDQCKSKQDGLLKMQESNNLDMKLILKAAEDYKEGQKIAQQLQQHNENAKQIINQKINYQLANYLLLQEDLIRSKIKFDQILNYIQEENDENNIYSLIIIYYIMFEFKQKEISQILQILQYKFGDNAINVLNNILLTFQDRKLINDSLKYLNCYQQQFDSALVKIVNYLVKEKMKLSIYKDSWNKTECRGNAQSDSLNQHKEIIILFLGDLTTAEICQFAKLKEILQQDNKNLELICNNIITRQQYCEQLINQFKQ